MKATAGVKSIIQADEGKGTVFHLPVGAVMVSDVEKCIQRRCASLAGWV